jgi:hypothetical protein
MRMTGTVTMTTDTEIMGMATTGIIWPFMLTDVSR